ncbi:MAG: hypothetical protein GY820_38200 [Gammaproteobacteria bacterium]|nr:hypothetical protein [Gammaproteobacteria bacterium]
MSDTIEATPVVIRRLANSIVEFKCNGEEEKSEVSWDIITMIYGEDVANKVDDLVCNIFLDLAEVRINI